jgi:glycosyltransferase involved in cell wall biosynthesis
VTRCSNTLLNYPSFTVLMAVYMGDDAALFAMAVRSVLDNTVAPAQFVVVADGPLTLKLEKVIHDYASIGSIEIVRLPDNVGLARALNQGLLRVEHDWVFRADADDFNVPERFQRTLDYLVRDESVDLVGGHIIERDGAGRDLAGRYVPLTHSEIVARLPLRNPFNHMTVAFKASFVKAVGGYPSVHLKEDYALWCRMAKYGARFANVDDILVFATAGEAMYQRRGGWKYIHSEYLLQKMMCDLGLKSNSLALVHFVARSFVFAIPGVLRGFVYRGFLRT